MRIAQRARTIVISRWRRTFVQDRKYRSIAARQTQVRQTALLIVRIVQRTLQKVTEVFTGSTPEKPRMTRVRSPVTNTDWLKIKETNRNTELARVFKLARRENKSEFSKFPNVPRMKMISPTYAKRISAMASNRSASVGAVVEFIFLIKTWLSSDKASDVLKISYKSLYEQAQ